MTRTPTGRQEDAAHLRAWRDSLGLSRQAVVNKLATIRPDDPPIDQATLAKWELGETALRVEMLRLLAQVYGVSPDLLLFAPGERRLPGQMRRALEIVDRAEPEAVERWLALGEALAAAAKDTPSD